MNDHWVAEPNAWALALERFEERKKAHAALTISSWLPGHFFYSGPWQHQPTGIITWNFYYLTIPQKLAIAKAWLKERGIRPWTKWKEQKS